MQYLRLYYKHIYILLEKINVIEKIDVAECQPLSNSIYYCCNYDCEPVHYVHLTRRDSEMQIANVLPMCAWEHLANDPSSIFIYEGSRESVRVAWLTLQLIYITSKLNVRAEQIYIILPDELHTQPLLTMLAEFCLEKVNVDFYTHWLYSIPLPKQTALMQPVETTNKLIPVQSETQAVLVSNNTVSKYTRTRKKDNAQV